MSDPRVDKLAKVLVHYSLEIKPGQFFVINTSPFAEELNLAVYEEAVRAGANTTIFTSTPGAREIFLKHGSDAQLDFVSPINTMVVNDCDAMLTIWCDHNTRELSGVDPKRMARVSRATSQNFKTMLTRIAKKDLRWCGTAYPTHAMAQDADMSLVDYQEFVYGAGMLNEPDPVKYWKKMGQEQEKLVKWLDGHEKVTLKGTNIDLKMSIKGRIFSSCDGRENFPDGEIFTGPVEDSVEGWVRFRYPAIFSGQEITDIQLWFEKGKVVKEQASKNQELLTALLDTDAGSRRLGEFGIGTNYNITRFSKNMLFDEKMGGTIHLAIGAGLPETNSKNESGEHWDMLCDMHEAEIHIDGKLFYKDGKIVI